MNHFQEVYCGHEYALQNLAFGLHVEPDNDTIKQKIAWVKERRDNGLPSVPSTIGNSEFMMLTFRLKNTHSSQKKR